MTGLMLVGAAVGGVFLLSRSGLGSTVPMANGNRVLPNGQVVNAQGQIVSQISQPATTRLYSAYAADNGLDAVGILKFAASTLQQLPKAYELVRSIIGSGDKPAAAGTAQQLLRDPSRVTAAAADLSIPSWSLELGSSFLAPVPVSTGDVVAQDPELAALYAGGGELNLWADRNVGIDQLIPESSDAIVGTVDVGGELVAWSLNDVKDWWHEGAGDETYSLWDDVQYMPAPSVDLAPEDLEYSGWW